MRKGKGKGERGREKEGGGGCERGAGESYSEATRRFSSF